MDFASGATERVSYKKAITTGSGEKWTGTGTGGVTDLNRVSLPYKQSRDCVVKGQVSKEFYRSLGNKKYETTRTRLVIR